jgi:hypothetical protein
MRNVKHEGAGDAGGGDVSLEMRQLAESLPGRFPGAAIAQGDQCLEIEIADAEVTVVITREEIDLRLQTVRWDGPHNPVAETRRWKKVRLAGKTTEELAVLVTAAAEARRKQYRVCRYCARSVPPEHSFSKNVCQSCAERHLGVVF